jgi:hypothetical protein
MPAVQSLPGMSLPPPSRAYTLLDGTGTVGWIADNRLGFTGFASVAEAATAAWVAHVALERRAAKSRREPAPFLEPRALQLVRSDGHEWIESAGSRLARLVRPAQESAGVGKTSAPWFGIEVVFPPDTSELTIGSSAHVVYRALRRSGMRWSIRDVATTVMEARNGKYSQEPFRLERAPAEPQANEPRRAVMSNQPHHSNSRNLDAPADDVDSASLDSFPASDPPKWSGLRLGPPVDVEIPLASTQERKNTSGSPDTDENPRPKHGGTERFE